MRCCLLALFILLLSLLGLSSQHVYAADAVVGTGTPASCTEAAFDAALSSASSGGGTITFNCGGAATISISSQKLLDAQNATYVIDGGGTVTFDGGSTTRLFRVNNGRNINLTLRGLTLQNGRAAGYPASGDDNSQGGAVLFGYGNGTLRIENSSFLNNVAATNGGLWDGGGAIHIRIGNLIITDSLFEGNSAPNGGAMNILITTGSVTNTIFRGNNATTTTGGGGGAIYIDNGMLTFDRVLVESNTSARFAAGYFNCGGSANIGHETIINSTFRNNTILAGGASGAGVYNCDDGISISGTTINNNTSPNHAGGFWHHSNANAGSIATVNNTTISGNVAQSGNGAGVTSNGPATMTITNSTITGNMTGVQGSAIRSGEGVVIVTNSIIANNSSAHEWVKEQCYGTIEDGGGNIQFPASAPNGQPAICSGSFVTADPLLAPLQDNGGYTQTHALLAGSPAIDSGVCSGATDQRGIIRPQGSGCDKGAFELEDDPNTGIMTMSVSNLTNIPINPTFSWSHKLTPDATEVPSSQYGIYIIYPDGSYIGQMFSAAQVCTDADCTATLEFGGGKMPPWGLVNGTYLWYVYAPLPNGGYHLKGSNLTISAAAPSTPTQIAPAGSVTTPTVSFQWSESSDALWYHLSVAGTPVDQWTEASEICASGICSLEITYLPNGNHRWYLNAWGPGGLDTTNPTGTNFGLSLPAPGAINRLSPQNSTSVGAGQIVFEWEQDANVAWYQFYVGSVGGSNIVDFSWYEASTVCGAGVCSRTFSVSPGQYEWYMNAWGPGGGGTMADWTPQPIRFTVTQ